MFLLEQYSIIRLRLFEGEQLRTVKSQSGASASSRPESTEEALGRRLMTLRQQKSLTMQQIAEASGLAQSTLSKIERGQMSPTLGALIKLARGLDVDPSVLISDEKPAPPAGRKSVTRRDEGLPYESGTFKYRILHSDLVGKKFHTILVTLTARKLQESLPKSEFRGEEFIYVLSGSIRVFLDHYAPIDLDEGDSLYFDNSLSADAISTSRKAAQLLCTFSEM